MTKKINRGFTLIEVVIAISIITVFLGALVGVHNAYLRATRLDPQRAKAIFLAEEGVERVRFARDQSWSTNIASAPSPFLELIDEKYFRETTLETIDDHTIKASTLVSWSEYGATTTVGLTSYLTNLYEN